MKFEVDWQKVDPVAKIIPELREFLGDFMENRKADLEILLKALEANDFEVLSRVGHTFKGMCEPYGMPELGVLGAHLEERAKIQNIHDCREVVRMIERLIQTAATKI